MPLGYLRKHDQRGKLTLVENFLGNFHDGSRWAWVLHGPKAILLVLAPQNRFFLEVDACCKEGQVDPASESKSQAAKLLEQRRANA